MKDKDLRPPVKIHILPGGSIPERKTEQAIGYDVRLRAIVSPWHMDHDNRALRKTLFDFKGAPDPSIARYIEKKRKDGGRRSEWAYRLEPGKMALCGIGFTTEMPFPLCYFTLCRSGMASKHNIMVANGPGTIDPDYRGEAGIILYNCGTAPFYLFRRMRIAQILFTYALIPRFTRVRRHSELSESGRGAGGFGSTGNH